MDQKALTAADILGRPDGRIEPVDVPEWGGTVYLRELPADEGLRLWEAISDLPDKPSKTQTYDGLYLVVGTCLCGPDGAPLFDAETLKKLGTRNPRVLARLKDQAMALQGWRNGPGDSPGKDA